MQRSHENGSRRTFRVHLPMSSNQDLQKAAHDECDDEILTNDGCGQCASERVRNPSAPLRPYFANALPTGWYKSARRVKSNCGNGGSGSRGGTEDSNRRMLRKKDHRQSDDHCQARADESKATDDRPGSPAQFPRAKDCELGGGRSREEVRGGYRILELVRFEPLSLFNTEAAQQNDVSRWSTEPDESQFRPFACNGRKSYDFV